MIINGFIFLTSSLERTLAVPEAAHVRTKASPVTPAAGPGVSRTVGGSKYTIVYQAFKFLVRFAPPPSCNMIAF